MANVFREYAYPYDTYLWMDPGADEVIERLISVVVDIATRFLNMVDLLIAVSFSRFSIRLVPGNSGILFMNI